MRARPRVRRPRCGGRDINRSSAFLVETAGSVRQAQPREIQVKLYLTMAKRAPLPWGEGAIKFAILDGYLHGKTERSVSDKGRDHVRYWGMK